jgi:NAD(P)-dependent dehydrogenase (short-subunit alcohol dehydrogenase family)
MIKPASAPRFDEAFGADVERAAIYPQNRVLEPREVAQMIAFLCSDAAGGVNGEAITVALGGIW